MSIEDGNATPKYDYILQQRIMTPRIKQNDKKWEYFIRNNEI